MTKIIQVWLLILVFSNRMSCKTSNHILSYLKNSCALLDCDIRVSQGWQMGILNTTSYLKTSIVCWRIGYQQWCGPPFIVSYILGETDHNENFSYTTGKHCHFQKLPFWDLFSNDDIRWVINVTKWPNGRKIRKKWRQILIMRIYQIDCLNKLKKKKRMHSIWNARPADLCRNSLFPLVPPKIKVRSITLDLLPCNIDAYFCVALSKQVHAWRRFGFRTSFWNFTGVQLKLYFFQHKSASIRISGVYS